MSNNLYEENNIKNENSSFSSNNKTHSNNSFLDEVEYSIGPFQILHEIGEGNFSTVYLGYHKLTNQKVCIKQIKKSNIKNINLINTEINNHKKLLHSNIIKIYCIIETENFIFIIEEYCSKGNLLEKILNEGKLSELNACKIFQQILFGLEYLHEYKICLRDLKPENILIEKSEEKNKDFFHIKVIDFGTCEILQKTKLTEQIGTSFYIAPEILKSGYNEKCDLWSCGVILYILLCGSPPFYGKNEKEIFKKILDGNFTFRHKIWNKISTEAKNLVLKLLQVNPTKRISAQEALEDVWFQKNLSINNPLENSHNSNNYKLFIKNITEFCAEQKLQQATLAFLVHNFAPKEELDELKKIFFAFDKNGDGKLSKEEFVKGLTNNNTNLNTILKSDSSIEGLLKNIDSDNNGYIGFEEFLIASINKEKILTEKNLKLAFNVFDRDKSGGISQNELKYILGEHNVNAKEHLWQKMIEQIDLNQDGQISYEEFHKMMMDVINNKNKRFSMQLKKLLLMDANTEMDRSILGTNKQNATVFESRPKKNILESNNDLLNFDKNDKKKEEEKKNIENNENIAIYKDIK
jgi:calcium-dependent protein kinase